MTVTEKIPIWLDCDPGNDDVFAILLSTFNQNFNLIGISTVHGNAPLSMTTHNTLALLDILNVYHIKVYQGSETPLIKPSHFAPQIHGSNGIGGVKFPKDTINQLCYDVNYLQAMKQAILNYNHKLCLICTGPLTNVSKLFTTYPELTSKVNLISIMGGGLNIGNVTPYAEFNFFADPDAADNVLSLTGVKINLAPLNLTHKVIATKEIRNKIFNKSLTSKNSKFRKIFYNILNFFSESYKIKYGITEGPPIHDPVALFSILPFLDTENENEDYNYQYIRKKLRVITDGDHQGESIIDEDESSDTEDGIYIGQNINVNKFWNELLQCIDIAEKYNKLSLKADLNPTFASTTFY
ncbi:uridine nucleosidase [Scheffersomyces coipomensis]|uniref:uridine nucleosidase n=1 Tax=Scheffersomyces coipomensis TaxID=1788519 RepID=UPI00315DA734